MPITVDCIRCLISCVGTIFELFSEYSDSNVFPSMNHCRYEKSAERCILLSKAVNDDSLFINPVYLFGAGYYGEVVLKTLLEQGKTIDGIYDNDPRKWGTSILGVPVLSTQSIDENARIFITSYAYDSDIEEQLVGIGIRKVNIYKLLA